jgi:hypothetical protein
MGRVSSFSKQHMKSSLLFSSYILKFYNRFKFHWLQIHKNRHKLISLAHPNAHYHCFYFLKVKRSRPFFS